MFNYAVARVQWLKCLLETSIMVKGTDKHSTSSAEKADVIIAQLQNSKLWPKETVELIETLRIEDVFTTNDRDRLVQYIGSRCDLEADAPTPSTACTSVAPRKINDYPQKQAMEHIENYLTATIWDAMERGDHVNYVMERVGKLFVDLR